MAANNKHKLKLLALIRVFQTETDADQGLSMPQIIERLAEQGIAAERKAIYRDISALQETGFDIRTLPKRPVEYALIRSQLSFDDVMMLIDIVQSSRFITQSKSNQLVKSLKSLVSERERKLLNKRVHVQDRVKNPSGSIFHNVDTIHEALQLKRKIEFLYFSYDVNLKRAPRHGGKRYILTPVKVVYANNNYYLAAYDEEDKKIKTYRIDRMELLQVSESSAVRNEAIANYEYEDFAYRSFGMYHGSPECVTLRVDNDLMDVIVDTFGHDVSITSRNDSSANVRVNVRVSPQFFGWVAGLDGKATIQTPKHVKTAYNDWLRSLIKD